MASNNGWDAHKMFDMYLYNHLVEKGLHTTAEIFAKEANVDVGFGAVDSSEHLLSDWWSIFYDTYFAKELQQNADKVNASSLASIKGKETMGTGLSQQSQMSTFEMNKRVPAHFPSNWGMSGQQETSFPTAKMYDEQHLNLPAGKSGMNVPLRINESLKLPNSARTESSMRNSCIPPQQNFNQSLLQQEADYMNLGAAAQSMPLYGMPKEILPAIHGPNSTAMHYGDSTTSNKWLLTGTNQVPLALEHHAPQGQQEHLAHLIAPTSGRAISLQLGGSSTLDTRNMMLPQKNMDGKVGQMTATALRPNQKDSVTTPMQHLPPGRKREDLPIARQGTRMQTAQLQDKRSRQKVKQAQKLSLPPNQNETKTSQRQQLPIGGRGVSRQIGGGTRSFSSIQAAASSLATLVPSETDQGRGITEGSVDDMINSFLNITGDPADSFATSSSTRRRGSKPSNKDKHQRKA